MRQGKLRTPCPTKAQKGETPEAHGPEQRIKQYPKAGHNDQKLGAICNCNNHAKDEGA